MRERVVGPGAGGVGGPGEERIIELQRELDLRQTHIKDLEQERTTLRTQVEKLNIDLARIQAERPRFQLDNFATSFKTMLESLQAPTVTPTPSGVQGTLRSIDLEIKGFVEVQQGKTQVIVPKPGDTIDANALSLVKMSFATVPTLPPPKT